MKGYDIPSGETKLSRLLKTAELIQYWTTLTRGQQRYIYGLALLWQPREWFIRDGRDSMIGDTQMQPIIIGRA